MINKKRILIMGCSGYGKWVLHMLDKTKVEPIAFVDNRAIPLRQNFPGKSFWGLPCLHPQEISSIEYDGIIPSVPEYRQEMREQLMAVGVPQDKIFDFDMGNSIFYQDTRIAQATYCLSIIKEHNIPGDIAEVGVYRGEFSSHLNAFFPSKKLYLFDTFEGFPEQEIKDFNNIDGKTFSETCIEHVLDNMPNKESCIIAKGYFPESIPADISQEFCFVSLDADLYKPMYHGLNYFWPRMSKGGYIFVHDYGTFYWPGTKEAVEQFCAENNVAFVPIFDRCLSVILVKN